MNIQHISAFKLSHSDGSRSRWVFVNDEDDSMVIWIKLKNGARHSFEGACPDLYSWAHNRELAVDREIFEFNSETRTLERKGRS